MQLPSSTCNGGETFPLYRSEKLVLRAVTSVVISWQVVMCCIRKRETAISNSRIIRFDFKNREFAHHVCHASGKVRTVLCFLCRSPLSPAAKANRCCKLKRKSFRILIQYTSAHATCIASDLRSVHFCFPPSRYYVLFSLFWFKAWKVGTVYL